MRGRWVPIAVLSLVAALLAAVIVSISVGENPTIREIRLEETGEVQELIAGIPQLGDRLGADDAPIEIDLFIDIQCLGCAAYMADVVDPLIAERVRAGEVKIRLHHRPESRKPTTLGAFGTVAAAEQNRGWQYAEIFARNLGRVPESGVDQDFLGEVASVTPKLDVTEWEQAVQSQEVRARAQADDELAFDLGIPVGTAFVIESAGTGESITLERDPTLDEVEEAIEELDGR